MIEIRKPTKKPIVVIRAATGHELSNYEKRKLAGIEEKAHENKIEVISVNGNRIPRDTINKEVKIELGEMAFKTKVTPDDLSSEELFFIKCELDESSL